MLKTIRWCLIGLCMAFAPFAMANVIYDVTVDYSDGVHTATYSFTMEFADAPPPPRLDSDLINPVGDFSNEKLVVDGVALALVTDGQPALQFSDPGVITFLLPQDQFSGDISGTPVLCGPIRNALSCNTGLITLPAIATQVVERASVPVAPTLALLVIGLAGLRIGRRRDKNS